jgi:hypothetical protein
MITKLVNQFVIVAVLLATMFACAAPPASAFSPLADSAEFASERNSTPMVDKTYPLAILTEDANCYSGPGDAYDFVQYLESGSRYAIIGKAENYWIIQLPDHRACWLWDQSVNVVGGVNDIPEMTPPAAPTSSPALGTIIVELHGPDQKGNNDALLSGGIVVFVEKKFGYTKVVGQPAEELGNGQYRFTNVSPGSKVIRGNAPAHSHFDTPIYFVASTKPLLVKIYLSLGVPIETGGCTPRGCSPTLAPPNPYPNFGTPACETSPMGCGPTLAPPNPNFDTPGCTTSPRGCLPTLAPSNPNFGTPKP